MTSFKKWWNTPNEEGITIKETVILMAMMPTMFVGMCLTLIIIWGITK